MSEPRNRLAEIVSDSLASATMGSDYVEAPEFSDEPGSLYVARLTNELASRGVTLAASERPPAVPPEGLGVERLRAAISEAQMNLWGRFPGGFSHDDLSAEAAHIYGLSNTGDTE